MLTIGEHEFHGPFHKADLLEERPGIYVVLCHEGDDIYEVLNVEVAEENVRQHLMENAEHDLWIGECKGCLCVAALYFKKADFSKGRLLALKFAIESELAH